MTSAFDTRERIRPAEVIFDGVSILTSPGVVMTPVPTTEALVDWAVEWIGSRSARVADVGTGSGAVAIALALRASGAQVWATDDSEAAVVLARANVVRHGLQGQVNVLLGDLLEPVPGQLDLVVANLPYHADARLRGPAKSLCRDQPIHAIYAPGDGLGYYRDLLEACRTRLDPVGAIAIQLYGAVLAAGRAQLDQLSEEMAMRADEGRDSRAAAASGEGRRRWSAWQSSEREKSNRAPAVVVGVDGSAGAKEALRWALREGRLRNSPVRVVHAWTFGYMGGTVAGYPYWGGALEPYTSLGVDLNDLQRAAEDLLERALVDVEDETKGVEIERQVVQGPAAEVLVALVTPSDLLVVGSRGHGGFAGLLLGSVSQQCVHHAPCPVVVVHAAKPTGGVHDSGAARTENRVVA